MRFPRTHPARPTGNGGRRPRLEPQSGRRRPGPVRPRRRRQQPAARPGRPPAAAGAGALRAGRLRRHRRPVAQEADPGDLRPGQPRPAAHRLRAARVRPLATGATATSRRWPASRAKEHARTEWNEEVWHRLAGNIRFVQGSFDDDDAFDSSPRRWTSLRERTASRATPRSTCRSRRRCSRWCSSRCSAPGWPTTSAAGGWRRVVVEKPFGHDLPSALELNGLVDEVFTGRRRVPHRPLPGQGDGPEPAGAALRQQAVRADLELQLRRLGADHHGRGRRHRRARRRSTTPPAPRATCCRTTCCNCSR